jgi:hypothetical protein
MKLSVLFCLVGSIIKLFAWSSYEYAIFGQVLLALSQTLNYPLAVMLSINWYKEDEESYVVNVN